LELLGPVGAEPRRGRVSTARTLFEPPIPTSSCGNHALVGMDMTLLIEPNGSGTNAVRVIARPS